MISDGLQGFNRIDTPTLSTSRSSVTMWSPIIIIFLIKRRAIADRCDQPGLPVIASTRVHTLTKFSYSGKVFHYQEELRGLANELS